MRWYGRTKHGAYVCKKKPLPLATATREMGSRSCRGLHYEV